MKRSPVVLATAAALLGGCGSSGTSSPATKAATQAPSASVPSAPRTAPAPPPLTKAAATAIAERINLRATDLPGFQTAPASMAQANAEEAKLARCAGSSPPGSELAKVPSPEFSNGSGPQSRQFSSSVKVLPSATLVARDLAVAKGAKVRSCAAAILPGLVNRAANGSVSFSNTRIVALHPNAAGADGAFGFRVTLLASAAGTRELLVIDELGVAVGRLEVALHDFAIGAPPAAETERRLLALLAARAVKRRV